MVWARSFGAVRAFALGHPMSRQYQAIQTTDFAPCWLIPLSYLRATYSDMSDGDRIDSQAYAILAAAM